MKKVLSLILSLAMILSVISVVDFSAYADSDLITGKCGDNVSYSFDSSTGTPTISGTGDMTNYTYDSRSPFYNKTNIKSVIIEKGVTSIGSSAFYSCKSLTSVIIPDGVTSIGDYAFYGCTKLTDVYYTGIKEQWDTIEKKSATNKIIHCSDGIVYDGYIVTFDGLKYEIYSNDNSATVCGYTGSPESVTILDKITYGGVEIPVTSIGDSAFKYCTSLTSVTIPDSVTSIGYDAFSGCSNLTDVYYSDTKAQWNKISIDSYNTNLTSAIIHCSDGITFKNKSITQDNVKYVLNDESSAYVSGRSGSPTSVTILDKITYGGVNVPITYIGYEAFKNCTSLTSVTIPNSVTSIGYSAFGCCSKLTDVYYSGTKAQWNKISNGDHNTELTRAVIHCSDGGIFSENEVIIDGLKYELYSNNTASVIGYTGNPTNVIIPKTITYAKETLTVTSIGYSAFKNCTSLTSVAISDSVTTIGDSFYDCTSLTDVYFSGTKAQWKSISIGYDYTYLTSAVVHCNDGVTFKNKTIIQDNVKYVLRDENSAYVSGYSGSPASVTIDKITYGGVDVPVTYISSSAFKNCTSLTSVTIGNGITSIDDYAFYDCTSLTSITIPDSVTSIGYYAFYGCYFTKDKFINNSGLEVSTNIVDSDDDGFCIKDDELVKMRPAYAVGKVVIPNGVTSIYDYAFYGCTSLTEFNVDDNNEKYSSQDGVLFNKDKTKLIHYPAGNSRTSYSTPNSVTSIGNSAFRECTSLTSVTIPDSVRTIGDSAFRECTSLTSITIPNSVTSIGGDAFYYCTSLTSVTIPNSVTSIGDDAFYYCTSLTSITIPNSVTSIGYYAFYGCTSLTSITIPNSVTSIGDDAFKGTAYYNDESNWENGVLYLSNCLIEAAPTNNDYTIKKGTILIADRAFELCTSLASVTIPDSVTSIGYSAFYGCKKLANITVSDNITRIANFAFKGTAYYNDKSNWENGALYLSNYLIRVTPAGNDYYVKVGTTLIANDAFDECKNLTDIYYGGTKKEWKAMNVAYTQSNYLLSSAVIHCSDGFLCNDKTVTVDKVKYILKDENNACVDGYVGNSTSVTIPDKITVYGFDTPVTDIKAWTLDDLTDVYFTGTKAQWIELTGGNCYFNYIVHCSDGAIFSDMTVTIDNIEYKLKNDNTAVIIGYVGKLTAINIPETISYKNEKLKTVSVDYGVFNNCSSLTDVYYTGTKEQWNKINFNENNEYLTSSVIHCSDGVIFNNKSVIVDDVKYIILDENNACVDCYTGNSSSIKISDKITLYDIEIPVTSIGKGAFYGCKSSTTITIPTSITDISDNAFENCGFINVKYEGTTKEFLKIHNIENNKALIIGRHYDVFNFNSFDVPYKQSEHLNVSNYLYSFIPDLITKRSEKNNDDVLIKDNDIYVDGINVGKLDIYYHYFSSCNHYEPYGESYYESDYERLHSAGIYIEDKYTDDDGNVFYKNICYDELKINFSNDSDYNESDKQYVNNFVKKLTLAKPQFYETDYEEYTKDYFNGGDNWNYVDKCASEYYNSLIDDPTIKVTVGSGAGGSDGTAFNPGYYESGATLTVFKNDVFYGEYYPKTEYDENGTKITSESFIPVLIIPDNITDNEIESYILQKVKKDYEGKTLFKFNAISKGAAINGLPVKDGYTLKTDMADTIIIARRSNTYKPSTPATNPTTPTQPATPTPANPTAPTVTTSTAPTVKKPKSTLIKKVKAAKKAVSVEWKKVSGVSGYEVQVATDKKFKKNKKTINIKKQKTTKTTVKKLKAKKKYYVRIRTYKTVNGKKVYSSWSKVKSVKTK